MLRTDILTWSKGDLLETYWKVFFWRQAGKEGLKNDLMTIYLNRSAQKHGGYIGKTAYFASRPRLPHGLHGIYISRYAHIGKNCWIYQNVTIGEVHGQAPTIGDDCLIGANAVLVGPIHIGDRVKIGAGAVIRQDVPSGSTVIAPTPFVHHPEGLSMKRDQEATNLIQDQKGEGQESQTLQDLDKIQKKEK